MIIDLAMAVVFLVTGGLLIGLRLGDNDLDFQLLARSSYGWMLAAVIGVVLYGVARVILRTWDGPWSDYSRQIAKAKPVLIRLAVLGVMTVFIVMGSIRFGLNLLKVAISIRTTRLRNNVSHGC